MSSKITLVQLSELCGVPAVSLHQWISGKRVRLSTKYQRAVIGPATGGRFSLDNGIEICLIAAQAKANVPLALAAARTRTVFKRWKLGESKQFAIFFDAPSFENVACIDRVPHEFLEHMQDTNQIFLIINTGAIIKQVERFFAQEVRQNDEPVRARA